MADWSPPRRSSFDGRDSYYHLDLDRCAAGAGRHRRRPAPGAAPEPTPPPRPAAGGPRRSPCCSCAPATAPAHRSPRPCYATTPPGRCEVTSAGSRPKPHLHPNAVRVLRDEFGIDISGQQPRHLDTLDRPPVRLRDHPVRQGPRGLPRFPDHPRRIHWSIPDPAAAGDTDQASYPAFQRTAADIDTRIRHLLPVLASHHEEVSAMTTPDQYASVRYLVDDVQAAVDFYTTHLGFTLQHQRRARLRRRRPRPAAAAAVRTRQLRRPRHPRRRHRRRPQPHPPDRRRPGCRDRPAPHRWPVVPQRPGLRPRRAPDPARRPRRQPHRTVPTRPAAGRAQSDEL